MSAIVPSHGSLPITLPDLLSNSLVLRQTAPYLPVSSIYALAATSRSLHRLLYHSPDVFRYLNLSTVKSAIVQNVPLDCGGISWRAERMDESLTQDEFYSGPLRGIFSKLERRYLLRNVFTLVLDGLSVPADLVREIIAGDKFNVRILSIREVKNLNERKLMQVLNMAVRPSRPIGTPRVKGIYLFGPREQLPNPGAASKRRPLPPSRGVLSSEGAQIGAEWNERSSEALNTALARTEDKWYEPSGRMFPKRPSLEWAETLKACEGIIAFDVVLCRGPRHDPANAFINKCATSPSSYLRPAIATVALGPSGCDTCHSSLEGPAVWGYSQLSYLPLLSPLPLQSITIRAAQMPQTTDGSPPPPLFVRCEDCLKGRWCERCHRWWDESCYTGSHISQRTELQQTELMESIQADGIVQLTSKETIKVHMGLCVQHCLVGEMMAGAGSNGMWG
jgi:hypothetical protein